MQATASEPPCPHRVRDLLTVTEPGLNGPQSGSRSALWRGVCATVPPATDTEAIPPSSPAISSSGLDRSPCRASPSDSQTRRECERVRSRNYFGRTDLSNI